MDRPPIWISGGTGLVGTRLVQALRDDEAPLRLVTRRPDSLPAQPGVSLHAWDGVHVETGPLEGAAAAVHLAGEPVFGGPATAARKQRIWSSRVESTRSLVEALTRLPSSLRPRVLVCASAVGFYGDRGEASLDESAEPGQGFLADLCQAWEREAAVAAGAQVRVVSLRIGIVLAREGGALGRLLPIFRLGLGGPVGSGQQWMPWVHVDDLVALVRHALTVETLSGPVNAVAPGPVRNAEFTRAVARAVRRPAFLRVPGFALRAPMGDLAGELLGSRRLVPARALASGFRFRHERLETALATELAG